LNNSKNNYFKQPKIGCLNNPKNWLFEKPEIKGKEVKNWLFHSLIYQKLVV